MIEEPVTHVILAHVLVRAGTHVHHPEGVHGVEAGLGADGGEVGVRNMMVWHCYLLRII